jgi:ketosteroid isomerase-like protein
MSKQNVEIVRRVYDGGVRELTSSPDEADLLELFDPGVHVDLTRRVLNPAAYNGYDGLRLGLSEVREVWDRFTILPERFIDVGDHVLVLETVQASGLGSGVEVATRGATLYTLRDGKIVRLTLYLDSREALEAVGLSGVTGGKSPPAGGP